MPELGNKYECANCGTRFYDLGRVEPVCPKCGANPKEDEVAETKGAKQANRRRAKAKVVEAGEENAEGNGVEPIEDDIDLDDSEAEEEEDLSDDS